MIFCPACDSRAVPMDKKNEKTKYKCVKPVCGREFRVRNK